MYRAKDKSRNTFEYCTGDITRQVYEWVFMSTGLRRAMDKAEFEFYYRQQVDMTGGELAGIEALLRWNYPDNGI